MAEPAGGRASVMFSPPTIPLNIRRGSEARIERASGGRADGGGRAPRAEAQGSIGSTHPTVTRAPGGVGARLSRAPTHTPTQPRDGEEGGTDGLTAPESSPI
eukprot:1169725-Pleurochrysis_carterae.AAC.1